MRSYSYIDMIATHDGGCKLAIQYNSSYRLASYVRISFNGQGGFA